MTATSYARLMESAGDETRELLMRAATSDDRLSVSEHQRLLFLARMLDARDLAREVTRG